MLVPYYSHSVPVPSTRAQDSIYLKCLTIPGWFTLVWALPPTLSIRDKATLPVHSVDSVHTRLSDWMLGHLQLHLYLFDLVLNRLLALIDQRGWADGQRWTASKYRTSTTTSDRFSVELGIGAHQSLNDTSRSLINCIWFRTPRNCS